MSSSADLLRIEDLGITFALLGGRIHAVKRANLRILPGKVTALVGESGSGKSVISQAVMGILPRTASVSGRILFSDPQRSWATTDILKLPRDGPEIRALRGSRIGKIFQEPMTSLSPLHTIGNQIGEDAENPHRRRQGGAPRTHHRDARAGRISQSQACDRHVSVRAFGRHAPARDDRHGADLPSGAADRRRADDGARRHHPGANPAAAARSPGQAQHGHAADHARSRRRRQHGRRGRRHLSWRDRRSRPGRGDLPAPEPSLSQGADGGGAAFRHEARRTPEGAAGRSGRRRHAAWQTRRDRRENGRDRRHDTRHPAVGPRPHQVLHDPQIRLVRQKRRSAGARGRRRQLRHPARRVPRPGRRKRLRQDHGQQDTDARGDARTAARSPSTAALGPIDCLPPRATS